MNIISKKSILILITVLVVLISITWVMGNTRGSNETAVSSIDDVVQIQVESGNLQSKLDHHSMYPMYYSMMNASDEDISTTVEEGLLETEALLWYSRNNNIVVTDKEVHNFIDALIIDSKEATEYQQYSKAAKKLGTTYEDVIRNNFDTYKIALVRDKLYGNLIPKTSGSNTEESFEKQQEQNNKQWDEFVQATISEYKKSSDFKSFTKELNMCETLYQGKVTSISKIQKAEKAYNIR